MMTDPNQFFAIAEKQRRDLLWSLFGPSLLDSSLSPNVSTLLHALDESSLAAVVLSDEYEAPARLGFRFEQLWQTALNLSHIEHYANTQIIQHGKTLGELDLLLPVTDHTLHIELALKFYLGVEDDWIGPNRRDLLSRKIAHTFEHQLPLASRPTAQDQIKELCPIPVTSYPIMRGCLFAPAHGLNAAPLPEEIAPDHWSGYWCPVNHLDCLPEANWFVLSKPDWISPVKSSFVINNSELIRYLKVTYRHVKTPLAIARMSQFALPNGGYCWGEVERWMMVAPDWH